MWKSHKPRFPHFHSAGDDSPFLLTKQPRCALRALAQQLIKGASANRTLCRALPYSGSSRIGINFPFRAHFALESLLTFRLICGLENAEIREELFAEVNYHAAYEPKRAVRTQRWKYIRNFSDRTKPVLPNCDDGLSKDIWLQYGWKNRPVDREQLYYLVFDPNERHNRKCWPTCESAWKSGCGTPTIQR